MIFYILPSNIFNIVNRCQYRLLFKNNSSTLPLPTAFSILNHFLGNSCLWIHLSPLAILYKMLLKSIPSINVMSYLHVISFWNTKRSRKICFRYQVPEHFTLNDVIMVTGVIGIRITRMNGYGIFWPKLMGYGILRPPLMGPHKIYLTTYTWQVTST